MKVRSYPGRAVLEDPELLLDPDATRGRAMELLYEASWRECGVNWTSRSTAKTSSVPSTYFNDDNETAASDKPYADVISQLEGVLDPSGASSPDDRSPRSSSGTTTSTESDIIVEQEQRNTREIQQSNNQSGFLIPRPRLIVPVHTYARRRRTGAPQPTRKRQNRQGSRIYFCSLEVKGQCLIGNFGKCFRER